MNKIYETDSYKTSCESVVLSCEQGACGYVIELDSSMFFPEEGGQYADTGVLCFDDKEVPLVNGYLCHGKVYYEVSEYIEPGTRVNGKLDFSKRFMRMQQHSGEHIVVGLIHNLYGFDNVGFHLSDDKPVTLDINGELSAKQLYEIESLANAVIYKNVPIKASFPTVEELKSIAYRSKIDIEGQVRLITIGDEEETIDICACCAPHVSHTGEIGIIKLVGFEKYKGGMRISILCGARALECIDHKFDIIEGLVHELSVKEDGLLDSVLSIKKDNFSKQALINSFSEKLLFNEIDNASGCDNACVFTAEALSLVVIKNVYNKLSQSVKGYAGVFVGDDEHGYSFNAGSVKLSAGALADRMRKELMAKCGGSDLMISGKVLCKEADIRNFFDSLEV